MSTKPKDGGPAYPEVRIRSGDNYNAPTKIYYNGMTLRDWFAGQAMQGLLANPNISLSNLVSLARESFDMADAMLSAREKGGEV